MNSHLSKTISGLILLSINITGLADPSAPPLSRGRIGFSENNTLDVEIAETQSQREQGLMHRTQLGKNQGMLFIYPEQTIQGVWMRNTLLALDVVFLSDDSRIVALLKALQPCRNDPCPIYHSNAAARYMLELNAGFIDNNQLTIGQELFLDYSHTKP